MKILVIEDEPAILHTLRDMLELNGHTVLVAADGLTGIELAAGQPDLILSDIGLPDLDGYQVMNAIQQMPECRTIPFIFLTARAERDDQRRGMALGADDYITKPFTEREILDALHARVRRQQPLRERIAELVAQHQTVTGASWSHELMTPLNSILGGLQLIETEADTIKPDELRQLLTFIRNGAERQQALAKKLVRYFHLEQMKANPPGSPQVTDAAVAVRTASLHAAEARKRVVDLAVVADAGRASMDETLLAAAVEELVDNAFQFSQPGQPVTVKGKAIGGRYRIEIIDQGPGMTPEECAHARPFSQFGRNRHEQQGLGLGLGIARSVAQLADGELVLQPGPGNRGLRALLDLPRA